MFKVKVNTISFPSKPDEKKDYIMKNLQWMIQPASDLCDLYEEHDRHVAIIGFSTEEALAKKTSDNVRSPMVCNMTRTEFACGLSGAIYSYAVKKNIPVEELLSEILQTTLGCHDFPENKELTNGDN